MVIALSLVLLAVAIMMLFGWGSAFLRLFRLEPPGWPMTVALGMAVVVFIGGILNLARLAYPSALAAVAILGVLLAWREGFSFRRPPVTILILIATAVIFTIATQLPPRIYNFHDDYQKYFAYPVRMIETGTVFGSSLSAMGLQTLGAQAFLDGFVVAFFSIAYINGVDAVFGLLLCLLLTTQFTANRAMNLVCVLSVVFINPQYVNISTLYCGSALMMAIVAGEDAASLGLLSAALIAMKPIYAVFVAIHLMAVTPMRGIRWAIRSGVATAIFLAPWALIHAPNYLAALRIHHPAPTPVPGDVDTDKFNVFSFEALPYGSAAANYTALAIAMAICGLICWRIKPALPKGVACAITGVATLLVFVYALGPMQYGYEHGLRYYVPVAIALAPAVFGLTAAAANRLPSRVWSLWLPLLIAIVPLAAFGSSLRTRIAMAVSAHSAASYSWLATDADYLAYNNLVLKGPERQNVRVLQDLVPAGEPVLAWMNTPFYLDYRRNRIIDIDTAGIGVPWARLPAAQYLIWDYGGFATADQDDYEGRALNAGAGERKDSMMTLDFIRRLTSMADRGKVLFNDGMVEVIQLERQ